MRGGSMPARSYSTMRYALISDIHANLPALQAVLESIASQRHVGATYHLGDLVGYAPWPNETVQLLQSHGIPGVAGNYDSTVATDEAGYSAILAFVIMGVATDERTPAAVAAFAIGATVFADALVTGPLTGGSFNPARALGPAVVGGIWTAHWLYCLAPVLGMVAAMQLYEMLRGARAPSARDVATGVEGPIATG
jgi:glycerol uptake facilitator-like aquaporin